MAGGGFDSGTDSLRTPLGLFLGLFAGEWHCCRWADGTDGRDTGMEEDCLVPTGLLAQPRLVRR